MRRHHLIFIALAVAAPLAGLQSSTDPQAKYTLTGRNVWKVLCSNGSTIDPFYGTYLQAINAPGCAPGYVIHVRDKGLDSYFQTEDPFVDPQRVAVAPGAGASAAIGEAAPVAAAMAGRLRTARAGGTCATAICGDSAGNRYDVVYLDASGRPPSRFDCPAAGLLSGPGRQVSVPGAANRLSAELCPVGPTLRAR